MTTQNDEAQRVRGYLIAQANKLSIPDLVAKVRVDVLPLRDAAAAIPAARLTERPGPDDWSAAEVLTHVIEMNENGARSIESMIAGGQAIGRVNDVISGATRENLRTADDYWNAFEERREQLLARVLETTGDENLDATITHPTFGAFSWREWLLFMRVHDLDHMRQLQAISQSFT